MKPNHHMSATNAPRTDAEIKKWQQSPLAYHVDIFAEFAKQLERELADALKSANECAAALGTMQAQRDRLAEALRIIERMTTPSDCMPYGDKDRYHSIAHEALTAVKGGIP
jgi:hypothetical protein